MFRHRGPSHLQNAELIAAGTLGLIYAAAAARIHSAEGTPFAEFAAAAAAGPLALAFLWRRARAKQYATPALLALYAATMAVVLQLNAAAAAHVPSHYTNRIALGAILTALAELVRTVVVRLLAANFSGHERLRWYRDIIQLTNLLLRARGGTEKHRSSALPIEQVCHAPRLLCPRAYFARLCDEAPLNSLADDFELLAIIRETARTDAVSPHAAAIRDLEKAAAGPPLDYAAYEKLIYESASANAHSTARSAEATARATEPPASENDTYTLTVAPADAAWLAERFPSLCTGQTAALPGALLRRLLLLPRLRLAGRVTAASIERVLPRAEAATVFQILSQGFDPALDYRALRDNMRQLNNERNNLLSTIRNNERCAAIAGHTLLAIEGAILAAFYICIFNTHGLFLKTVIPLLVCVLPVLWNLLDSFIFILVAHPYDIGDRVHLDGDNLIVKDIGLTRTVFERWNNEFVVVANQYVKQRAIKNIRRSRNQQWRVEFLLSAQTSPATLQALTASIKAFVDASPAFDHVTVAVEELRECHFQRVAFTVRHTINHQNGFFMWQVQNRFMKRLVAECVTRGIQCTRPEIRLE